MPTFFSYLNAKEKFNIYSNKANKSGQVGKQRFRKKNGVYHQMFYDTDKYDLLPFYFSCAILMETLE